jgi:hypothetical protein
MVCIECNTAGMHPSWSQECPTFLIKCSELDARNPKNQMLFYLMNNKWMHIMAPPAPSLPTNLHQHRMHQPIPGGHPSQPPPRCLKDILRQLRQTQLHFNPTQTNAHDHPIAAGSQYNHTRQPARVPWADNYAPDNFCMSSQNGRLAPPIVPYNRR